jgi:hypothetical protein
MKQLKHLENRIATYVYNHFNIHTKHLQHMFKTAETFETYTCNICVWPLQHIQH